jgi:capsular polysaccharide biosynthesis protein
MSETQQADTGDHGGEQMEDEIELMDYLRVIWKWKYLIVTGTVMCAVAAGVISFLMPKVYRIGMVVRPGIISTGVDGNNVYIDSAENIKAIIEAGTFDREILDSVKESNNSFPKSLQFKVNIPKDSDTIKISHENVDVDRGLQILADLGRALSRSYSERVAYIQNEHEAEIDSMKAEVSYYEVRKRALEKNINNTQKRIEELTPQIDLVRKNTASLIGERDKFLSNSGNQDSMLVPVFYMNTIQHNISLENSYRQEIDSCVTRIEDEKFELKELDRQSDELLEEIRGLEFKKNSVQNIEILQPPTASPHPIKPKIKLNVMIGTILGLFVMLFLAFFLEYIQRHRGVPEL